jgi:hypothetical protein
MWVLTDDDNEAAAAVYERAGATERATQAMFGWTF